MTFKKGDSVTFRSFKPPHLLSTGRITMVDKFGAWIQPDTLFDGHNKEIFRNDKEYVEYDYDGFNAVVED